MKSGLVMEGGALRTIFSCGVCDAFLDTDVPMPDYFVGVSGGDRGENLQLALCEFRLAFKFTDVFRNFTVNRSLSVHNGKNRFDQFFGNNGNCCWIIILIAIIICCCCG